MDNPKNIVYGPTTLSGPLHTSYSGFLFERVRTGSNLVAQINTLSGKKATYLDILQKSVNLATSFRKLGVKKGDIISLYCENRFEFTECTLAIIFVGAVVAPINILYSQDELKHTLKLAKPIIVICSRLTLKKLLKIKKSIPSIRKVIEIDGEGSNLSILPYNELLRDHVNIDDFQLTKIVVEAPVIILNSSGSTGMPTGVILTHHNLSVIHGQMRDLMQKMEPVWTQCLLHFLPWFQSYGFITHLLCLALHLKYVFMSKFEDALFLRAIEKYKVTFLFMVPSLMEFLAIHPIVDEYNLSSLKEIWCGAAPLSKETQVTVSKRLNLKNIYQAYGMTETGLAVTHGRMATMNKPGSCGKCVPGLKIKVVDLDTKESLGPYRVGEFYFKGPQLMAGYIGDDAANKLIFDTKMWFHSGDIGYYDTEEHFFIVGRLKELIKYKSFQVPPAEIESCLLQHPAIVDAGVVGIPEENAGELPTAFVVRQPDSNVTKEEIKYFVAQRLSHNKHLYGGVIFIDEIPRNASGKILSAELKNIFYENSP